MRKKLLKECCTCGDCPECTPEEYAPLDKDIGVLSDADIQELIDGPVNDDMYDPY